jgi:hypothetical protein
MTHVIYEHTWRCNVVSSVASLYPVTAFRHYSLSTNHFSFRIMKQLCLTERCYKALYYELRVWNVLVSDQMYFSKRCICAASDIQRYSDLNILCIILRF